MTAMKAGTGLGVVYGAADKIKTLTRTLQQHWNDRRHVLLIINNDIIVNGDNSESMT